MTTSQTIIKHGLAIGIPQNLINLVFSEEHLAENRIIREFGDLSFSEVEDLPIKLAKIRIFDHASFLALIESQYGSDCSPSLNASKIFNTLTAESFKIKSDIFTYPNTFLMNFYKLNKKKIIYSFVENNLFSDEEKRKWENSSTNEQIDELLIEALLSRWNKIELKIKERFDTCLKLTYKPKGSFFQELIF